MNPHLYRITTLTYKIELIKGRNVSLILVAFNIMILIIMLAQEFLYLSEHKDYEIIVVSTIVTS